MAEPLKGVRDRYSDAEIAHYYEQGYWQTTSFNSLLAEQASARGDSDYVIDRFTSLTYRQFVESALRLAVGLRRYGIDRGDRVAAQLPNWTEFPMLAAALSRIGAILVPIMPIYRDDEVAYVLQHSGAKAVVTCGEFRGFDHFAMMSRLRAECPALASIIVTRPGPGCDHADAPAFVDLMATGEPEALELEAMSGTFLRSEA